MLSYIDLLNGKKTYLVALALGLVAAVEFLGYLDVQAADLLRGILLGSGLAALRDGVNSLRKNKE